MDTNQNYEHIPKEKFAFAHKDGNIHDIKLQTKSRGYFADAMLRFKKNQSSVAATWIIGLLVLFAIVSPLISPYDIKTDKDKMYQNFAPYVESVAQKNWGILDGGRTLSSANELTMTKYKAIAQETGMDPVIKIKDQVYREEKYRGQMIKVYSYRVKVNSYYEIGIRLQNLSYETFADIQKFQNESGLQVLYPVIDKTLLDGDAEKFTADQQKALLAEPNIWYVCADTSGTPVLDKEGNFIPAYSTNVEDAGPVTYDSLRIDGDDGSYIYSTAKSGSLQCRVSYYNYYQYLQWAKTGEYHPPRYFFGTNTVGQDLFCAIGVGARFSLIFAVLVSAINLTIGAIYGAIQGYYGGVIDLTLDRISDILSGVPFIVVATLFKLHLAAKVGAVPSFLFAFVLTGWIGMASLTRKQFYRFKSQEHILAARTLGAGDWRLMFKHIFPNALGTIITSCAMVIPGVISSETSLTYLGIVNLSEIVGTSMGVLMQQGQAAMTTSPHAMFFPAIFFSLLMISFNLFGNGLRDAFNPTMRGAE